MRLLLLGLAALTGTPSFSCQAQPPRREDPPLPCPSAPPCVCDPPSLTGAYDLTLTRSGGAPSIRSTSESCGSPSVFGGSFPKGTFRDCNAEEQARADVTGPSTRLYLSEKKDGTVTVGLDDKCSIKRFDRSVYGWCDQALIKDHDSEHTYYELQLSDDGHLTGTMRYLASNQFPATGLDITHTFSVAGARRR